MFRTRPSLLYVLAALGLGNQGRACLAAEDADSAGAVVVTATRIKQPAFELPVSIDSITSETLRDGRLQVNLSESMSRIPGVVVENRQNYAQDLQISSRGFGARASFGVRGIRLYADGIPATMPDGQGQVAHFDIGSAEALEVMRGPFSVLYGNASGGVIALMTEEGGPDTVAEPSLTLGSFGTERLATKLSGANQSFNYVLSGSQFRTDGYREHSAAKRETLNAKITATPAAGMRLTLVANDFEMPKADDPLGLTRAQMDADPQQAGSNALLYNARKTVSQQQAGMVLEQKVGAGGTASMTLYAGQREAVQFQSIVAATQAPATHPGGVIDLARDYNGADLRWTQALPGSALSFTLGLSQENLDEARKGYQNFVGTQFGVQGALRRDEDNTVVSRDVYFQLQWQALQNLKVLAGVRRSRVNIESSDHYIAGANLDDSGATSFSATTPALGLTYRLGDRINLYGSYGRGFESPTLNELSYQPSGNPGLNFALQAARSKHLEAGVKMRFGTSTRLNLAAFNVATEDEISVATNAGGRSSFRNAGRTRRSGMELSLETRYDNGLGFLLAYTDMSARYRDAVSGASPSAAIAPDNKMPGIPAATLFAEASWRHAPSGFVTALELRHVGRVWVNDGNTDSTDVYSLANLRFGLEQQAGRWTVKEFLRIDNLADRRYAGTVIVNESLARYFEPAPGRNSLLGVSASYTF